MISSLENSRQNNAMDQPRQLVLASTSRYRRELLERLGLRFETAGPDGDESALPGEAATEGRPLGKPGNHANAARQLRSLSGKSADFHTAVSLLDSRNNETQSRVVLCRVVFRALDERRIQAY